MRRSPQAMSRQLDDEVVILDVPSGRYFSLNAVGVVVWDRLADEATIDDLVDAVTAEFEVDPDTARSDIDGLVASLTEAGLLEP